MDELDRHSWVSITSCYQVLDEFCPIVASLVGIPVEKAKRTFCDMVDILDIGVLGGFVKARARLGRNRT